MAWRDGGLSHSDRRRGRPPAAQQRHPYRPAHLHALIAKPGYKVLISQVYDPSDPHIDSDVQLGVTRALVGNFVRRDGGGYSLDHTYVMERGEMVLPKPPIK